MCNKFHILFFCFFFSLFDICAQSYFVNARSLRVKASTSLILNSFNNKTISGTSGVVNNDGTIICKKNWDNNSSDANNKVFTNANTTGTVEFKGTSLQSIGGTASTAFEILKINNSAHVQVNRDIEVSSSLNFTSGVFRTLEYVLSLSESASVTPTAGSSTSFVDGKIKKNGNGSSFVFPVGNIQGSNVIWAPLEMAAWNNTNDFTVGYAYKSPYDSLSFPTWNTGSNLDTGLHHVSGKEFWLIDRSGAGNQTPAVKLFWKNAVKSDIANTGSDYAAGALESLRLVHWNTSTSKWENLGASLSSCTWPSGSISNTVNFTSYSPVTIGTKVSLNPLPVYFNGFSSLCNNSKTNLFWYSYLDSYIKEFKIEGSNDASLWLPVGTVPISPQSYFYSFEPSGNFQYSYYRLSSISFDGESVESEVIYSACNEDNISLEIYPNPFKEQINITIASEKEQYATIMLFDMHGKIFENHSVLIHEGINSLSVPTYKLTPAPYLLKFLTETHLIYKEVIKL